MLLGGEYKDVTFEFNVMDPKKPVITTVGWEVVVCDSYVHERDVMYANFFTITTKVMIQDLDTKINYVCWTQKSTMCPEKSRLRRTRCWCNLRLRRLKKRLAKDVGARGEVVTTEKLEREAVVCSGCCAPQNWWKSYCCGWSPLPELELAYFAGTASAHASLRPRLY